jgi:hypothetical protein
VLAHGISTSFGLAAIFDVVALLLIITLMRDRPAAVPAAGPADRSHVGAGARAAVRIPDTD